MSEGGKRKALQNEKNMSIKSWRKIYVRTHPR